MDEIVYLVEIDKDGNEVINQFGFVNQTFFKTVRDAMYYMFITFKKFHFDKKENSLSRIVVDDGDETKYYLLRKTKPLEY